MDLTGTPTIRGQCMDGIWVAINQGEADIAINVYDADSSRPKYLVGLFSGYVSIQDVESMAVKSRQTASRKKIN